MKCAKLFRCFVVTIWVQEATIQINEIKYTQGLRRIPHQTREIAELQVTGAGRAAGRENVTLPCSCLEQPALATVRDSCNEVEVWLLLQCCSEQNSFLKLIEILIVSMALLQLRVPPMCVALFSSNCTQLRQCLK